MGCNISLEVVTITQPARKLRAVTMPPYWLPQLRFEINIRLRDSEPSTMKRSLYHKNIKFTQTWIT